MIHFTDWLRAGTVSPLQWGDSLSEIIAVWPTAQQEAAEVQAAGCPYLPLDCIELYFETDDFSGLQEVLVKAWAIAPGDSSPYLSYDWLHEGLSFAQVKTKLKELNIEFRVEYGPHFNTPAIIGPGGTLFAFDTIFDEPEETELLRIYFSREPIRVR